MMILCQRGCSVQGMKKNHPCAVHANRKCSTAHFQGSLLGVAIDCGLAMDLLFYNNQCEY